MTRPAAATLRSIGLAMLAVPALLDLIWSEGAIYILGFEAGLRPPIRRA